MMTMALSLLKPAGRTAVRTAVAARAIIKTTTTITG
jgi:hypothetical protein